MSPLGPLRRRSKVCFASKTEFQTDPRSLFFSEMTSRPNAKPAFAPPALPTLVAETPGGGEWLHEVKHDGYRAIVAVEDGRARIFTRRGHDDTDRMPVVPFASRKLSSPMTALGQGRKIPCWRTSSGPDARLQSAKNASNACWSTGIV
jgi:hypothetical protein